jgi:hypothetical protein
MSVFATIKSKYANKDQLKQACSAAVSGLHMMLQLTREAAGYTGVPGLQAGITVLLSVLDMIKVHTVYRNRIYSF